MIDTAALAGFIFLIVALMFGGKRRRSFAEATHTAAGLTVGTLCLAALLTFLTGSISHLLGLSQTNYEAHTYLAQADDQLAQYPNR
jgi:uncharacterized iron-regulated membrane protein